MILDQVKRQKRQFNVNNQEDIEVYRQFMLKSAWGPEGNPFYLEFPYEDVPYMIKDKLIRNLLEIPEIV